MREIRFRAFNKKTREMEPVLLICFVNKYVDVLPERNLEGGSQESWGFEDIELMQFCGLKDKNGKGIWEGDILKYGPAFRAREAKCSIEWQRYRFGGAGFLMTHHDDPLNIFENTHLIEVIGNIHQNPELA